MRLGGSSEQAGAHPGARFRAERGGPLPDFPSSLPPPPPPPFHRPYFWNSHSVLSSGQTWRVFSQREMQWKWKAWLHTPQATVHSSVVALAWFAWHSMPAGG